MKELVQQILDWAEVWALLIPLAIVYTRKPKQPWVRPLKYYLLIALLINLVADIIWKRMDLNLESWMRANLASLYDANGDFDNTILYNIHSILRLMLFAWFFSYIRPVFKKVNLILEPLFLLSSAILFIFYKDIRDFNSLLLASEAALLLVYCLIYYFIILRDEDSNIKKLPAFWVVTGLSIYVVINFPIFLFYNVLSRQSENFAMNIWDIHNLSYLLLCLFIAKSFYAAGKQ